MVRKLKDFDYWSYYQHNSGLFWIDRAQPTYYKYTRRCSVNKVLWNFKQSPWKIPKSTFFSKVNHFKSLLVKLQVLKWIHSHVFFKVFAKSLSNLVNDFWEDCFHKLKLLLAANRLIYLNISKVISNIHSPRPLRAPKFFLHRKTTSGETFISWSRERSKLCEINYNFLK